MSSFFACQSSRFGFGLIGDAKHVNVGDSFLTRPTDGEKENVDGICSLVSFVGKKKKKKKCTR